MHKKKMSPASTRAPTDPPMIAPRVLDDIPVDVGGTVGVAWLVGGMMNEVDVPVLAVVVGLRQTFPASLQQGSVEFELVLQKAHLSCKLAKPRMSQQNEQLVRYLRVFLCEHKQS